MARPAPQHEPARSDAATAPNPVWFKPIMISLMLIGLVWVIVFYLSGMTFPVPGIGAWNLIIGFGIAFVGFIMTIWWR